MSRLLRGATWIILAFGILVSMPGVSIAACGDSSSSDMNGMAMPTEHTENAPTGAVPECCDSEPGESGTAPTGDHCVLTGSCGLLLYAIQPAAEFAHRDRPAVIVDMPHSKHLALVLPPDSPPPRV